MSNSSATPPRFRWWTTIVSGGLIMTAIAVVTWYSLDKTAEQYEVASEAALARGRYAEAVRSLEEAIRIEPDRAAAWKLLAEAACGNDQPERSQAALEKVAALEPQSAGKLSYRVGMSWMNRNRVQPAIRALRFATVLSPAIAEPYRLLAQMYGVTGSRQGVAHCLVELLKRRAVTRNDLVVLSSVNPTIDDPDRLNQILAADPSNKSPLLITVMKELDRNRVEPAKNMLIEIVQAHPENLEAQGMLGELYADHDANDFLDWHTKLPSDADDDARIWLARAKWLLARGEAATAIRCLHESFLREPENATTTTLLGQLLKSQGEVALGDQFTERVRHLQRIIDLSDRMNEPRGSDAILPMIDEMEAAGRWWEAWGWCAVYLQTIERPDPSVAERRDRLENSLTVDLPRTIPSRLPGVNHDWQRYPLPDWSRLKSDSKSAMPARSSISEGSERASTIRFEDRSELAGLDFRYAITRAQSSGHKIYETMGAGVAVLDYDVDGWPDLYLPQGKPLPLDSADGPSDALYRNELGKRYRLVTVSAAIREVNYSQGVSAGDFNGDGFPDLYVANIGRNCLFVNNGDGTFSEVTVQAGLTQAAWTVSCAIADLNGDGFSELFDVNYVQGQDVLTATCFDKHRRPIVCRPTVFDAAQDTVLWNLGDGRFQELQADAGLDLPLGRGLGLVIADNNGDGRLDVFIANDMSANFLLMNESTGVAAAPKFRDEAFARGVALDRNGLAQACMGVASADINRDGQIDLFVTNFARESNTLYLSQPGGLYQDETQPAGLREPSFDPLGFGTQFLDADRDGWFDLVVANGHIDEFLDEPYRMKAQVFRGQPRGRFQELFASEAGSLFDELRLARGLALLDWNRDGRTDFVATDLERPVLLAENVTKAPHHSLRLALVATEGDRDAIGAIIKVRVSPGDERVCQLTAGDGYESSNERILEVGTTAANVVTSLEIHWPSGTKSRFENLSCVQGWKAIEGRSELIPQTRP